MPSLYNLKPKFQVLLKPALPWLNNQGITPNHLTLTAIALSAAIGAAFASAADHPALYLSLPAGLLLRMALNALDGMLAREYNQKSQTGEVLNELGDVVSDLFIYAPLLLHHAEHSFLIILFLLLTVLTEFAGVLTNSITGERRYDGPLGKSDRAAAIGIYGLVSYFGWLPVTWVPVLLKAAIALLTLSTYNRLRPALN